MKKTLLLAAIFSLAAPAAFGQEGITLGTPVYFENSRADADSADLVNLITRALDKSRILHLIAAPEDEAMEVRAPISMVKEADGQRVRVTFEVTPAKSVGGQVYSASCPSLQLYRCADAIAERAERIAKTKFQ